MIDRFVSHYIIYICYIIIFAKKGVKTRNSDTSYKNIKPEYGNGIWHGKIYHTDDENGE